MNALTTGMPPSPSSRRPFYLIGGLVGATVIGIALLVLPSKNVPAQNSLPQPTVSGYELLLEKRISRTVFEYTYKARVTTGSTAFTDGVFRVESVPPGFTVLDGELFVGNVPANSQFIASNTFRLRQDRSIRNGGLSIGWSFDGKAIQEPTDPIAIVSADFVEYGGRAGHEGLLPIGGSLVGSTTALLQVRLTARPSAVVFRLVTPSGATIATTNLLPNAQIATIGSDFLGATQVPSVAFQVAAQGTDRTGRSFDVKFPTVFQGNALQVKIDTTWRLVRSGATIDVVIHVTNGSTQQDVTTTVSADQSLEINPTNQVIVMAAGESRALTFQVTVPPSAENLSSIEMIASTSGQINGAGVAESRATLRVNNGQY